jgi:hypothetical protein
MNAINLNVNLNALVARLKTKCGSALTCLSARDDSELY